MYSVAWLSVPIFLPCGTRQGGMLSPCLFARYITELLSEVVLTKVGCNIGGTLVNNHSIR